jgi:hypothetical protein
MRPTPATTVTLGLLLAGACRQPQHLAGRLAPEREAATTSWVVTEAELDRSGSGNLLTAVAARIRSMSVSRPRGECPEIILRGPTSMTRGSPPGVYVDGTRAINTCVLDQLTPGDVARVEVYPMGMTRRPGYHTQAGGLILVFMRDGS